MFWGCPPFWVWLRWFPTLPHPGGCSTIGVHGLSFQVRDGAGRFPVAVATASLDCVSPLFFCVWGGVGSELDSGLRAFCLRVLV